MTGPRLAASALLVVLAACGDGTTTETDVAEAPTGEAARIEAETPSDDEAPTDADAIRTPEDSIDLTAATNQAAMDLAGRLGMGSADIQVFSAERVTWRDGSVGCPEDGAVYTQALVHDGYRIVFTANGELHHYHGAGDSPPMYCPNPQDPYEGEPDS